MSVPLDRLYHYVESLAQQLWSGRVIIYSFYPHGAKEFQYLTNLHDNVTQADLILSPYIYCHDQEPLNYVRYENESLYTPEQQRYNRDLGVEKRNMRDYPIDIWDHALILHSELRSLDVQLYQLNGFVPVYYWSHALIARDWYRYAQHIAIERRSNRTFLIYNRAWSGTREYRLGFMSELIKQGLADHCRTWFNPVDPESGAHYHTHKYRNSAWQAAEIIEQHFEPSTAQATASADFDIDDYELTDIEVVLETLFDDGRLHLTEKVLRPMALAQPFLLMATAGSLTMLRAYGFETFSTIWDESYDQIQDPQARMQAVVAVMKHIADWTPEQREQNMARAREIAERNKLRFFSEAFEQDVLAQLQHNLAQGLDTVKQLNTSSLWLSWQHRRNNIDNTDPAVSHNFISRIPEEQWAEFVAQAKIHNHKPANALEEKS